MKALGLIAAQCCLIGLLWTPSVGLAQEAPVAKPVEPPKSATATAPESKPDPDSPKLLTGDRMRFRIKEDPSKTPDMDLVMVPSTGDVEFPISYGAVVSVVVNAKNKTLAQVKEELTAKLMEDYYHRATVELFLLERGQRGGQILIFGSVRGGSVTLNLTPGERLTIFEAVMKAGPDEFANMKKIKLMRADPDTRKAVTRTLDLEKIRKGDNTEDIPVQDGDRIEVVERGLIFK